MSNCDELYEIKEGSTIIRTKGKVFYNPVQEFNRDLSISVLNTFVKNIGNTEGIRILEALSATGLRSIRYAKEVTNIKKIIANDISNKAVENIKANIKLNNVEDIVVANQADASMLMYENRNDKFDAIDLDPYGCPSIFLDSAIQAVKNGGLLLVTATDMAILAGNSPETCYSKYGAISLKMKACHEMAIRILLQCIEAHANRYGRYIVPLLSLSVDFYIRVYIRVFTSPKKCKQTLSKLSMVHTCTGCGSFLLQPLGIIKVNDKNQPKYGLPTNFSINKCDNCGHCHHIGGPIWNSPIHSLEFVQQILEIAPKNLSTYNRIEGILTLICEELLDIPLYYTLEMLSGTLHVETPKMLDIRSAILNAGYRVSFTHMNKTSIKTDAGSDILWDIMRTWAIEHPVNPKRLTDNSPAKKILDKSPSISINFEFNPMANPESKKKGLKRFQTNPQPFWGPGTRSTTMLGGNGDQKVGKKYKNQGKRKREKSGDSCSL